MTDAVRVDARAVRVAPRTFAFAAIVLGAGLVRLVGVDRRWLWYDELLSANWSVHGPWDAVLLAFRFDVHAPLYYVQLSLWALAGRSDLWLMLNGVAWSMVAVAALMHVLARTEGDRVAFCAGALLALAPAALAHGDAVRMYPMLMALTIWAWDAQSRWLSGAPSAQATALLIVSQLAVLYTHGAGAVMLSGCLLYAALKVAERRDAALLQRWALAELTTAALAAPSLVFGRLRDVAHAQGADLAAAWETWRFLAAGALAASPWGAVLGAGLLGVLVWVCAVAPKRRLAVGCLVFAPMLAAALISLAKPIWIDRIFVPVVPFLAMALAFALTAQSRRLKAAAAAVALTWCGIGVAGQMVREKGDGYRPAAAYVAAAARPGDLVLVDGERAYWCFLWYFAGPDWGHPREAAIFTSDWRDGLARLHPRLADWLGFNAKQISVRVRGIEAAALQQAPDARTRPRTTQHELFIVRSKPDGAPIEGRILVESRRMQNLVVERWR
ncbi:MAG: hypothetical protein JNJ73_09870 [Hyphomonadaceae bacterium]|nr:hypothetical protein [Hyphomonadaceae bacterium]